MSEVPNDEKEAANYVQQLYRDKDKMMDSFLNHGDFFTGTNLKPLKPRLLKPRIYCLGEYSLSCIWWTCSSEKNYLSMRKTLKYYYSVDHYV